MERDDYTDGDESAGPPTATSATAISTGGAAHPDAEESGFPDAPRAEAEFHAFFEQHHRQLARLAYLLTSDHDAADDITADAFTAAWRHWGRVRRVDNPLAYMRRTVANMATSRLRRIMRERRGLGMLGNMAETHCVDADVPAIVDVRAALMSLPARKRECVVLRYAFDLSEHETARTLGISVGTVKSQTSKGAGELERLLETSVRDTDRWTSSPPAAAASASAQSKKKSGARKGLPRPRREADPSARLRGGEAT